MVFTHSSPATRRHSLASALSALFAAAVLSVLSTQVSAAEHVVQMLNQGTTGAMVFEPSYIKAEVGDTVVFQPTQRGGHNSKSTFVPDGAASWDSAPDTETRVELTVEGVYVYVCQPHLVMGMSGVIQVGAAGNLEAAKASASKTAAGFALNKDRLSSALANVK